MEKGYRSFLNTWKEYMKIEYHSIAFLAKGHWIPSIRKYSEAGDHYKTALLNKKSNTFELWFVFTDHYPNWTSSINQIDLVPDIRPYDSYELKKAVDDLDRDRLWRCIITTALGIYDLLNQSIKYGPDLWEEQRKIAFWRTCKTENIENHDIPFLVTPNEKIYDKLSKIYDLSEGKSIMLDMDPRDKYFTDSCDAFVIDEILEIRHAKIESAGKYSLYDESTKKKTLLNEGVFEKGLGGLHLKDV